MTAPSAIPDKGDDGASPFDALKHTREDGSEFWSARDLMKQLGYTNWQNFDVAINRTVISMKNQNIDPTSHVTGVSNVVARSQGGSYTSADYELSRFACYLATMNGDPRKPQIAAAQAYFAIQTRFAEKVQQKALESAEVRTEVEPISVYEIGTLFEEVRDEFDRVVDTATMNTPTAHNLSAAMHELAKSITHLVYANNPPRHLRLVPNTDLHAIEALPPLTSSDSFVTSNSSGIATIRISEDVEDPITWDEFARTEGLGRCGSCASGLSSRIKHAAVKRKFPRGRTPNKHNVFARAVWRQFYAEWRQFYEELHVAHKHGGACL